MALSANKTESSKETALPATVAALHHPYAMELSEVMTALGVSYHGLSREEAIDRLRRFGYNALPRAQPPGVLVTFLRQFLSPLIYILLIAAAVSLFLHELSDAVFIFVVLLVNAIIGTLQEYSAQRSANALNQLVTVTARVLREGEAYEINADELVPGDIVLLESGNKVPADIRLISNQGLQIDESLLTGESLPVLKQAEQTLPVDVSLGDRLNMAFAGTLVTRGRGRGVIVGTGLATELGLIASAVVGKVPIKPPLLLRMERFTFRIAMLVTGAAALMAAVAMVRGTPFSEIFLLAVALAVSAIPEGLPVAMTVALAIGMERMAKRNVIVRRLVAVESLGSCTFIVSDKTGTLTVNELTARRIVFGNEPPWEITGEGMIPEGTILTPRGTPDAEQYALLERLCQTVVLSNEGALSRRDNDWTHYGDAADVALLVMAHKMGIVQPETNNTFPQIAVIPFESEHKFSAALNVIHGKSIASVKGAMERLLPMCSKAATLQGESSLDAEAVIKQAHSLAAEGYRVLAVANGEIVLTAEETFSEEHLHGLTFIGLVGMIDPLRIEAKAAVAACRGAGIQVSMVTGDHPITAFTIARELELANDLEQVVTGPQLAEAEQVGTSAVDALTGGARVFARIEPQQKLAIVDSLRRSGHFVAVTGDGANDAPAMRAAHVGVSMGKRGTDVARETSDLIITDDNFASIVAGVEEGRVAYANVRKVIFLLVSTGAAELVLFTLALFFNLPLPLLAAQLLWLNLVTNGIQDVALAFEKGEGHELAIPPRSPKESIFNRLMLERVVISALVMGLASFGTFQWLLNNGYSPEEARNSTLLLMVLFENIHVFNSRSEIRSAFAHNPLRNKILLFGTIIAQLIHIGAMYTPWLNDVLRIQPVSLEHWANLLLIAVVILIVMEIHKYFLRYQRLH